MGKMVATGIFNKIGQLFSMEWMQIMAILSSALVALNTSILYAWPSPSIPILISDSFSPNVTMEEASYTIIIPALSSILSSTLHPYLMDFIGRKQTLLTVALPQLLSWILLARARNMRTIYASRFLSGLASSCLPAVLPIYIGEICSPHVRGLWGNAMSCCVHFGICLMNIVGSNFDLETTAWIFAALPVAFFLLFSRMPESPYYLLMKNDHEQALMTLNSLRTKQENVRAEFQGMQAAIKEQMSQKKRFLDVVLNKTNRKALVICLIVRGAQQFSGIGAFALYAPYLFLHAGNRSSANSSAIIYTGALTVCSLTGSLSLDRLGRRRAMILSCSGCALVLFAESAYFYLVTTEDCQDLVSKLDESIIRYFPIMGMLLYVVFYSLGMGIVPNLIQGELFPINIKCKASCVLNIAFGVYSCVVTKIFHLFYSRWGMFAPFLIFAVGCSLSTVLSYLWVPETSGKTLEEIQVDLRSDQLKESSVERGKV